MQTKGKRKRIVAIIVAAVLLITLGIVVAIQAMTVSDTPTTKREATQESTDTSSSTDAPSDLTETQKQAEKATPATEQPTLDPSTVATVEITPMNLVVSYVRGIGGFEYEVLRTPSGLQYVEFKSPELIGTKCTNDEGVFASILEDPSTNEGATVTRSVKLGETTYGLSLAGTNCTSDAEKLRLYQESFTNAFGLLKTTN